MHCNYSDHSSLENPDFETFQDSDFLLIVQLFPVYYFCAKTHPCTNKTCLKRDTIEPRSITTFPNVGGIEQLEISTYESRN